MHIKTGTNRCLCVKEKSNLKKYIIGVFKRAIENKTNI